MTKTWRGLIPHGGPVGVDAAELRAQVAHKRALLAEPPVEDPQPWIRTAIYAAKPAVTTNTPSGINDGLELADGSRVFAECYNVTVAAGAKALAVTLRAGQNGVRAYLECDAATTISGGSVRWWVFEPIAQAWHLGGVDETVATGVRRVATTDQLITVGAR